MIPITTAFYSVPALTFITLAFIVAFSYETRMNSRGFKMLIGSFSLYFISTLIYAIFINVGLDSLQTIPFVILMASNLAFYASTHLLLEHERLRRVELKILFYVILPSLFHAYVVLTDQYLFLRGLTSTTISIIVFINILVDLTKARQKQIEKRKFSELDLCVVIYLIILFCGFFSVLIVNVNYEQAWTKFKIVAYILSSVVRIGLGFGYTLLVQKMIFQKMTKTDYVRLTEYDYIKHVSETDHLTQIYNRQKIDKVLYTYSNTKNLNFSVLFIDVDNFKHINDKHGHQVGDEVLKAIAQSLKHVLRNTDMIGRWGGDEFLVILDDPKEEHVNLIIKKLKKSVNDLDIEGVPNVSVSIGAYISKNNESINDIISEVDQKLYFDKEKNVDKAKK